MHPKTQRILDGHTLTAARLMRDIDDERPEAWPLLSELHPHTGRAHRIGLTGSPGVGKSSLANALITTFRARGDRVGVIAVDPSSPFSGGAILGDRVRMGQHAADPGVFIRSVATRGALGGLSRSVNKICDVLDAMGFERILVETVGVGQAEVDIVRSAHSTVVVLAPGLGDDIQAVKAGLMEIADLFVVNKADLVGAKRVVNSLRALTRPTPDDPDWTLPILPTTATTRDGLDAFADALDTHRDHLHDSGLLDRRRRARQPRLVLELALERLTQNAQHTLNAHPELLDHDDPYVAAQQLLGLIPAHDPPAEA